MIEIFFIGIAVCATIAALWWLADLVSAAFPHTPDVVIFGRLLETIMAGPPVKQELAMNREFTLQLCKTELKPPMVEGQTDPPMVEGWYIDRGWDVVTVEKYVLFEKREDAEQWIRDHIDADDPPEEASGLDPKALKDAEQWIRDQALKEER